MLYSTSIFCVSSLIPSVVRLIDTLCVFSYHTKCCMSYRCIVLFISHSKPCVSYRYIVSLSLIPSVVSYRYIVYLHLSYQALCRTNIVCFHLLYQALCLTNMLCVSSQSYQALCRTDIVCFDLLYQAFCLTSMLCGSSLIPSVVSYRYSVLSSLIPSFVSDQYVVCFISHTKRCVSQYRLYRVASSTIKTDGSKPCETCSVVYQRLKQHTHTHTQLELTQSTAQLALK